MRTSPLQLMLFGERLEIGHRGILAQLDFFFGARAGFLAALLRRGGYSHSVTFSYEAAELARATIAQLEAQQAKAVSATKPLNWLVQLAGALGVRRAAAVSATKPLNWLVQLPG